MILRSAFLRRRCAFARRFQKVFLLIFACCISSTSAFAQTTFTKQQFSRLPLLTRAAFFEREILQAAEREGVDPNLLWTIAYNETRFRPWLTSPKNARGMMQFIPSTADRFGLTNPYEPSAAIRAAAKYVKVLSNLFGGRADSVLAAYNAGEGAVLAYQNGRTIRADGKIINASGRKTLGGVPPYSETMGYVGRGLKIYRWLIERGTFPVSTARADFPNVISATVASVKLFDPEIGNAPSIIAPTVLQASRNTVAAVSQNPINNKETPGQPLPDKSKTKEVYYDARSGNRYVLREDGGREILPDAGQVVINGESRRAAGNIAHSTFFAAPATNK